MNDDEDDVSTPAKNTKNYLWWIPNIVVSQTNLTVGIRNITWLKPAASQEVEMKQYNITNDQFILFNPGSLGRCFRQLNGDYGGRWVGLGLRFALDGFSAKRRKGTRDE